MKGLLELISIIGTIATFGALFWGVLGLVAVEAMTNADPAASTARQTGATRAFVIAGIAAIVTVLSQVKLRRMS